MSEQAARAALERMNLREVAVARHYNGMSSDLRQLAAIDPAVGATLLAARRGELCEAFGFKPQAQTKPFAFAGGIAIIPFSGTLINRFNSSYGFITGYNWLRSQMAAAHADEDVLGIVGDFNSYGGEAAGCFELATDIAAMRGTKPMLAVVDSNCYSAAYALASAFDKIVCTPSGGVGSIGVLAMHVDLSKMLDEAGIKVTFIHAGDHKVDGNMFQALPKEVKADIQRSINVSYEAFVNLVAENRDLDVKDVKATEAQIYRADEAKELGLIDIVSSANAAMQSFFGELSGSQQREVAMTTAEAGKGPVADTKATEQQLATAQAEARTAERARVQGIIEHAEAAGRTQLANHLAMKTEMSVADAGALLAASPKVETKTVAPGNPFEKAMDKSKHPEVGTDAAAGGGEETNAEKIIKAQEQATGVKLVSVK